MNKRFHPGRCTLWKWYLLSVLWLVIVLLVGWLTVFRGLKNTGSAQLLQFDDVPLLRFLDIHYAALLWSAAGLALVFLAGLTLACSRLDPRETSGAWPSPRSRSWRGRVAAWLPLVAGLFVLAALLGGRYGNREEGGPTVYPVGLLGWLLVPLAAITGWLMSWAVVLAPCGHHAPPRCLPSRPTPWMARLAVVFLLGFVAVCIEALWAHWRFWDPARNGNHDYLVFLADGEVYDANLVLYSTSVAFASVAALAGCAWQIVFRLLVPCRRPGGSIRRGDCVRIAGLSAAIWSFALGVPWQIKILPEIRAENGWIMPAIVLVFLAAGLAPMIATSLVMIRADLCQRPVRPACPAGTVDPACRAGSRVPLGKRDLLAALPPRPSEFALWGLLLFPFYPLVRWLPPRSFRWRYGLLMLISAAVIAALLALVTKIDDWFDFDDWRDMLRGGEFPFLKVYLSLVAACFVYLVGRRLIVGGTRRVPLPAAHGVCRLLQDATAWLRTSAHALTLTAAVACLAFASWPFWGWGGVHKNVFARCVEFNDRHKFELSFLHWVFDLDRDHYAAVLHGADPDDFDPQVQAGGLAPPETVALPVDQFAVVDRAKAKGFPNLAVFYLEGVVPRSIGAYGHRRLPGGLAPTPHMDAVAAEGTIFTQARCFYPSTWDAWFAASSGRFVRIAEMHAAELFGDHYSPHNNLYRILDLAGIDRWCHADTPPYSDLLVPRHLHDGRKPPWQPAKVFDSSLSAADEEHDVWRGDKRAQRIVDFLDDLKPGERFFFCEHMADTHFPWRRTSKERAAELGFPNGLEPYEADADLPGGLRMDTYSRYFQTITRMDAQIGKILQKLRQRGLYDRTMIVIVSDHGCQWWEHERMYYVSHVYDPSLLVPLIVRVPGLPGGGVCDEPVLHIDLVPTVVELAGVRHVNEPTAGRLPGRSLLPAMRGRGKVPPDVAAEYRGRDVPLLTHYDMLGVIHDFRYKLIFYRPLGTYLLFDLREDPGEMTNLADSRPELLEDMLGRLRVLFTENKSLIGRIE